MTAPVVYVAGPFSAPTRAGMDANIAKAVALGIEVARVGAYPVIPHANTAHPAFEQIQPYQFWIDGTMALLRCCDAVIMVEGWAKSSGARGERNDAIARDVPVFVDVESLRRWVLARAL
jgi:hypothetical protein